MRPYAGWRKRLARAFGMTEKELFPERDVIKAFNEAMNPTPPVGVENQLLKQLKAKAKGQLPATKVPTLLERK